MFKKLKTKQIIYKMLIREFTTKIHKNNLQLTQIRNIFQIKTIICMIKAFIALRKCSIKYKHQKYSQINYTPNKALFKYNKVR